MVGDAEKLTAAIVAASSPGPGAATYRDEVMQIQIALSADEQADAMQILRGYGADTLEEVLRVFDLASLDECTTFLRNLAAHAGGAGAVEAVPSKTWETGNGESVSQEAKKAFRGVGWWR